MQRNESSIFAEIAEGKALFDKLSESCELRGLGNCNLCSAEMGDTCVRAKLKHIVADVSFWKHMEFVRKIDKWIKEWEERENQ